MEAARAAVVDRGVGRVGGVRGAHSCEAEGRGPAPLAATAPARVGRRHFSRSFRQETGARSALALDNSHRDSLR